MIKVIADSAIPYLEGRLEKKVDLEILDPSEITKENIKNADALLVRTRTKCNADLLEGTNVRFVATATAGADHIDAKWCEKNGIFHSNAPGCNAPGVAQYVMASLLRSRFDTRNGTLGVVGKGNIGSIVTTWARNMGIEVVVCDPPRANAGHRDEDYLSLEELLRRSTAVTFHVQLKKEGDYPTFGMLNEKNISLLPHEAILINASRGGVIEEKAAISHLGANGQLIIDTWKGEPRIDKELLKKAFIATPHIAGYSLEGKQRATRMVLEQLNKFFGLDIDTSGLAPAYQVSEKIAPEAILDSYNPFSDMETLKSSPDDFEWLRDHYNCRPECRC